MKNKQLYANVKAGFVAQHTSLRRYCIEHGIYRQNARDALLGIWTGDKANEVCELLIKASGAEVGNSSEQVTNLSCQPDALVGNSQLLEK